MKHAYKLLGLMAALALPLHAQEKVDIKDKPATTGSAISAANDSLLVFDASEAAAGRSAMVKLPFTQAVNVPGFFSAVPNATFTLAKLAQSGATSGQVATWNGSVWAPATPATATVDNATVNTALSADPAASLAALRNSSPLLSNESRLLAFWKQLAPFQASSDPVGNYIVMAGFLDSIGTTNGPTPYLGNELISRFGVGALLSPTLAALSSYNDTCLAASYAGGAAIEPAGSTGSDGNWTYLPNGRIYNIPSGGSVTETPANPMILTGFQKIRVFYGIRSAGGTISVTVTQNGSALTTKTANTATGTVGGIGYIEFTSSDGLAAYGQPSIVTSASSARVDGLGALVYLRSGAIVLNMGRGSSTSTDMATVPAANFTYLQDTLGLSLAVHAAKGETNSEIDAWFDKVATNMPKVSHLVLGNSPSNSDATDLQSRERMRTKALEKKFVFFDAGEFFQSYSKLQALGWEGDGTHLATETWRLQAGWLANRILNLNFPGSTNALRSVMNPVTQRDLYDLAFLQNTTRRASFDALYGSSTGSGWTRTTDRGRNSIAWTTATSNANTDNAWTDLLNDYAIWGYQDAQYRWQMTENFGTCDSVTAKIMFGSSGTPQFTKSTTGFDWEFGFDTVSAVLTPWVRIELHDGTNRYQSPKFYIPIASGAEGYIKGATTWHNWALRYDGSGGSSKRFRVWCSPSSVANNSAKTVKPMLVLDWSVSPSQPNWYPAVSVPACVWGVLVRGAPASSGYIKIHSFEADHNFRDPATLVPSR